MLCWILGLFIDKLRFKRYSLNWQHRNSKMNYSLIDNNIMVELYDETNEGWNGDYNPNNPHDDLLLRFDISQLIDNQWESVDNASYCTQLTANLNKDYINKALHIIMREVREPINSGLSVKKICENISWISIEDLRG